MEKTNSCGLPRNRSLTSHKKLNHVALCAEHCNFKTATRPCNVQRDPVCRNPLDRQICNSKSLFHRTQRGKLNDIESDSECCHAVRGRAMRLHKAIYRQQLPQNLKCTVTHTHTVTMQFWPCTLKHDMRRRCHPKTESPAANDYHAGQSMSCE